MTTGNTSICRTRPAKPELSSHYTGSNHSRSAVKLSMIPKTFKVDLPEELTNEILKCKNDAEAQQVGIECINAAMQGTDEAPYSQHPFLFHRCSGQHQGSSQTDLLTKYRHRVFKDVIGQDTAKQQLIQEVREGRIPHATVLRTGRSRQTSAGWLMPVTSAARTARRPMPAARVLRV